jgi:hypothetical protein
VIRSSAPRTPRAPGETKVLAGEIVLVGAEHIPGYVDPTSLGLAGARDGPDRDGYEIGEFRTRSMVCLIASAHCSRG